MFPKIDMVEESARKELVNFLLEMKEYGYKGYINTSDWAVYGMIMLEENVIYIQYTRLEGWTYTLEYVPTVGCGSGCRSSHLETSDLSLPTLRLHEKECMLYAKRLNAKLYPNVQEAVKQIMKRSSSQYKEV